jgi:hypothetical protein
LIRYGGIVNCPITAQDVVRAIYGQDVGSLKGKTKRLKSEPAKVEYVKREVSANQTLYVDVMFIESEAYLVSMSKPLGLTQITQIASRSVNDLRSALHRKQICHDGVAYRWRRSNKGNED